MSLAPHWSCFAYHGSVLTLLQLGYDNEPSTCNSMRTAALEAAFEQLFGRA